MASKRVHAIGPGTRLTGEVGNDVIEGGDGNDLLAGGDGKDTLRGDAGKDVVFGGLGDDELHGGLGSDVLFGEAGADSFLMPLGKGIGAKTLKDYNASEDLLVPWLVNQPKVISWKPGLP